MVLYKDSCGLFPHSDHRIEKPKVRTPLISSEGHIHSQTYRQQESGSLTQLLISDCCYKGTKAATDKNEIVPCMFIPEQNRKQRQLWPRSLSLETLGRQKQFSWENNYRVTKGQGNGSDPEQGLRMMRDLRGKGTVG